ncbi:cell wall glycosyl hydrolase YteR [Pochonia chlamydosporia 170]|uniref:Cell wall glycosyl hydrolase YteR n=1 Tax=Pochonia chlamydosporia 170 TaxID=1380566 RepID=A0A179FES0_METCM|nr:cell wall glycosyl hydrolase YteR [Pochonia chlamydosporia 170]OAQ64024.1 cell wall glycosyl hydrolase YteR [Pochonia chlamydosporia 170]
MRPLTACLLASPVLASRLSTLMLDSIISRNQGITTSGEATSTLEIGLLGQAFEATIAQYPSVKYTDYLTTILDLASANLTNATVDATKPLDRFSLATAINSAKCRLSAQSHQSFAAINASLALQKRNPDGGFWYYVYPEWSYADGMFSLLPFMAAMPYPNITDMKLQINLLRDHCTQTNTSLLYHGYDWSRKAVWADKTTGASPYVWGRALAWFLTGLVQTWDTLSCNTVQHGDLINLCSLIKNITFQVSSSLVQHADPATGAWWQIVTLPGVGANYLESSSTALFTFSMLKALRTGLLYGEQPDYKGTALRAYKYTVDKFVTDTGNGTVGFDKTVSVCSLNSSATFEYYTTRPILQNSLLGEAAFVLAALEAERLE